MSTFEAESAALEEPLLDFPGPFTSVGPIDILILKYLLPSQYTMYTYPVQHCQVHPHAERFCGEMNTFRQIRKELVVERLHPVGVTTLYTQ